MQPLDSSTVVGYLRAAGLLQPADDCTVAELDGRGENVVLRVEGPNDRCVVVKQARDELPGENARQNTRDRIFREVAALKLARSALEAYTPGDDLWQLHVPEVLLEDRENFAFVMTAAPVWAATWHERLRDRDVDLLAADAAGTLLGVLHAWGWQNPEAQASAGDSEYFESLRVGPLYRHLLTVHPELSAELERLLATLPLHRFSLVHGEFTPANLLLWDQSLLVTGFEAGHFGDPACDAGRCLAELVQTTIWSSELRGNFAPLIQTFWDGYRRRLQPRTGAQAWMALEERTIFHLAGCLLAAVDGQSPAADLAPAHQEQIRDLARFLLTSPPETIAEVKRRVE